MGRMRPGRGRGGYLEIWLAGVDVALPPVKMRRGAGKTVLLPTPAEWIADMFSAEAVSAIPGCADGLSADKAAGAATTADPPSVCQADPGLRRGS